MTEPIDVVVASDHVFFSGLQTTVASAVFHEQSYPLCIHVLDGGILESQWQSLEATVARLNSRTELIRHSIDLSRIKHFRARGEFTVMAYARLLIPSHVDAPFAIYIDSDFLVTRPLSSITRYLSSGKAVYGSIEGTSKLSADCPFAKGTDISRYSYINTGFLLMNLEKWRKDKIDETVVSFLAVESVNCRMADQTAINWVLRDDIEYIPKHWNTVGNELDSGTAQGAPGEVNLHYASGMKPWRRPLPKLSHDLWWLFTRTFLSAECPPNPCLRPQNFARYARYWMEEFPDRFRKRKHTNEMMERWKRYWGVISRR